MRIQSWSYLDTVEVIGSIPVAPIESIAYGIQSRSVQKHKPVGKLRGQTDDLFFGNSSAKRGRDRYPHYPFIVNVRSWRRQQRAAR